MGTGSGAFLIDAYARLAANPPFLVEEYGMAKTEIFDQLGAELDAESWAYLCQHLPRIADSLETAVIKGASPEQVRAFVQRTVGGHRDELARRCESAARHLLRSGE